MTRFSVDISDELCTALDTVSEVTGASRRCVLAVLIRVHIHQLMHFMGNQPDTIDGGDKGVKVEEMGNSEDAPFLDAKAINGHELELLIRAVGLTQTPTR